MVLQTFATSRLVAHCVLLAWSATWQSLTLNELANLAVGISYWSFGNIYLQRVNPRLPF